jgi:ComEC/Rec2-related protein
MAALVLAGLISRRRPHLSRNLGAAALLLLAWEPDQLFDPGFQFSFLVLMSIVTVAPVLLRRMSPLLGRDPLLPPQLVSWNRRARDSLAWGGAGILATSLAAFLGAVPLALWHFRLLSPVGILLNVAAIPLAFGIVGLGIFSVLTGWALPVVAVLLNNTNLLLTHILLAVIQFGWQLPGSHTYYAAPDVRPGPGEVRVLALSYPTSSSAILLQTRRQHWLIDCGDANSFPWLLESTLNFQGVNRLDGLVLTHGDSRHIGGALEVLEEFRPRQVLLPSGPDRSSTLRRVREELAAGDWPARTLESGLILDLGDGATLRVLYPPAQVQERYADDRAAVLLVQPAADGATRALLMSDAGFLTEQSLRRRFPDLRADTVIYSGHATDFFATAPFLKQIRAATVYHGGPPLFMPRSSLTERLISQDRIPVLGLDQTGALSISLSERPAPDHQP